ncbi:hypothetical protein GN244_ATG15522 [Phytophthora infestans]|uniref:Uncharacterized protein n=1 Tax=Phytophthora infestans TaxID=4787 RepID=A0A833SSM7_PHYIN|nr:hypothetical protein GN244_ATG15522 [Phytophthora infestans]
MKRQSNAHDAHRAAGTDGTGRSLTALDCNKGKTKEMDQLPTKLYNTYNGFDKIEQETRL